VRRLRGRGQWAKEGHLRKEKADESGHEGFLSGKRRKEWEEGERERRERPWDVERVFCFAAHRG
jgi:hypothetical protein